MHLEEGFHCVINAPQQKLLGTGIAQDASKICEACNTIKQSKQKILELEKDLKTEQQKTITFRYPKCKAGGSINELGETPDKQTFDTCPKTRFHNCKVKYCIDHNCEYFTWREVEAKKENR